MIATIDQYSFDGTWVFPNYLQEQKNAAMKNFIDMSLLTGRSASVGHDT